MKFLHTMLRVKDIKKSLDFYTKLLDMQLVKKKYLDDCELYFLSDQEGTAQIELTYNNETPKEGYTLGSGFGHLAFGVNSLEDFTKKLNNLGYEYLYEPFYLNDKGTKIAFVKDPDGYEIELIQK